MASNSTLFLCVGGVVALVASGSISFALLRWRWKRGATILPYFGAISEIISAFSWNPIFGYTGIVLAAFAIADLSRGVWLHHMFTSGTDDDRSFRFMSFLIAVPAGVKFFDWITRLRGGSISFETSILFSLSFWTADLWRADANARHTEAAADIVGTI